VPPLRDDEIDVWWARAADSSPELLRLLDGVERERLAAYRRSDDRARFLVGCSLAKIALASYRKVDPTGIRLARSCSRCGRPHGKPRLVGAGEGARELSVSHSGDLVAVAVARAVPVGIDVERLDGALPVRDLADHVLSAWEQRELAAFPPRERARAFLVYWTRKEAIAKAAGEGLREPLAEIVVTAPAASPKLLRWQRRPQPRGVSLFDLRPGTGYVAALAALAACESVNDIDGSSAIAAWTGSA
jgi:4'-phosphopantetheinyl transferase